MQLAERMRPVKSSTNLAREYAPELSVIRSVDDLHIDYSQALSIKRGDLSIIQGEVFRCFPLAPHLAEIPLILKRLECVDRRTYDLKVYEADTLARFQGHCNIVSLYSFWSEKPQNAYTFKTLSIMMEEGILGDMMTTVVHNPKRPPNRIALKYLCDITKGLIAVHNCNIIHARLKPSCIYLRSDNTAMIGEFGKTELDQARMTHQLYSKLLIREAIPKTLGYWAPELLRDEKYGKEVDMWALGVTIYQICTGEHPFNIEDEVSFRDDALHANVDISRLDAYPRIAQVVQQLLCEKPADRWNVHEVLVHAQYDFAVEIQRVWRGHVIRREYRRVISKVVQIQAHIKGHLVHKNFWKMWGNRRRDAAIRIQSAFRGFMCSSTFQGHLSSLKKCQANILRRTGRAAYISFRQDVVKCQSVVRGFLVRKWYAGVRGTLAVMLSRLEAIQSMVAKYQDDARLFAHHLPHQVFPAAYQQMASYEDFELATPDSMGMPVTLPKLRSAHADIQAAQNEAAAVKDQMKGYELAEQAKLTEQNLLRQQLGDKYCELDPMIEALKKSLMRVADNVKLAEFLPIKIQHIYTYSKWDQVHEPHNVVENVLKDDQDQAWRSLQPEIDLTCNNHQVCFVSEVVVWPGECGPQDVEVYVSNVPDKWTLINTYKCSRELQQSFMLPGEQLCKYVRLRFPTNVRGGNIVTIQKVRLKGTVRE